MERCKLLCTYVSLVPRLLVDNNIIITDWQPGNKETVLQYNAN